MGEFGLLFNRVSNPPPVGEGTDCGGLDRACKRGAKKWERSRNIWGQSQFKHNMMIALTIKSCANGSRQHFQILRMQSPKRCLWFLLNNGE